MGKVFSYEQVRRGKVPSLDDFMPATEAFLKLVQTGTKEEVFDGGFVFGSVARGMPNIRSDFDSLIALNGPSPEGYVAVRSLAHQVAAVTDGRIEVDPKVYPKEALEDGAHEIHQAFGLHLLGEHRLVAGNDPANYLYIHWQHPYDIVDSYVHQKARKLSDAYVSTDPLEVSGNSLQRTLELPNSVGRKLVEVLTNMGEINEVIDGSDKEGTYRLVKDVFYSRDLGEQFDRLTVLNSNYTILLEAAVKGEVTRTLYDDALRAIHAEIPRSVEWLRNVGRAILPVLARANNAEATYYSNRAGTLL